MNDDEHDNRTVAERRLEEAMDALEKHHPAIAKRLRTKWHKETVNALGLEQNAENMRAVAAAEREAERQRETPYADDPDIANEEPPGFWQRFWGRGG